MKKMKKVMALLLAGVMALGVFGCGGSQESSTEKTAEKTVEKTKVDEIKDAGKLVLGTASGYPPFEFVSVENDGAVIGIDIALAQAIADELGVALEVQDMAYSELITALTAGNCDVVIAGMPESAERAEVADFSEVYVDDTVCLVVRAEDADQYTALSDFAGKKIASEMGSTAEAVAMEEIPDAQFDSLSLIADCFLELENGKCDAVVVGLIVAQQYVSANDKLQALESISFENSSKPNQACVAKGDTELLDIVNKVIKENQDNGNFDKWIQEYSDKAREEAAK